MQLNRPNLPVTLLFVWVLIMISTPIVRWTLGEAAMPIGITAGVLAQVLAVLAFLLQAWGRWKTLKVLAGVVSCGWLAEWVGSSTGFPFGSYDYTPVLQPQLLGVPVLIPLAWLMMLPPSWAVAESWLRGRSLAPWARRASFIAISAAAFTAWDLFLDPQMVAWGFWVWEEPGAYFGIPLVNYVGWLLVSGVITALLGRTDVPTTPMILIYAITWGLQTIGQTFFWAQAGPALFGFAAMGVMLLAQFSRLQTAVQGLSRSWVKQGGGR